MKGIDILVLEDSKERQGHFRRNMAGNRLVIVETAAEAISKLSTGKYDFLLLDHDLGGQAFVPSGPGTGYEVACWLEEHHDMAPGVVVIHSLNDAGARRMQAAVKGSYLIQGAWIFTDLVEGWEKVKPVLDRSGRCFKSLVPIIGGDTKEAK